MRTATLTLLGAVIAAQTYAMPGPTDSTGGSRPTVTVQRGVAWFYGHRFEAPFTLGYSADGLAIDGYSLPREIRPAPKHSPTHGDTLRSQLSARMPYKDRPGPYSVVLVDPENVAQLDMTSEDLTEKQRGIQWKQLLQLKDHFESVGLVV